MSDSPDEERSPIEEAMDLFIYAPIGMALTAAEELPEMIRKGREAVEVQMDTAKVIGRVAVNQGKVELNRLVSQWNDLGTLLRSGVMNPRRPQPDKEAGPAPVTSAAPAPSSPPAPPAPKKAVTAKAPSKAPSKPATDTKRNPPPPDDLGIPGYGSLSASQVVSRLPGLSPEQLEAVKAYESSTRRRRTILGRIAQLQGETSA